ncbi:hypothetical protein ACFL0J_05850 [Candidatus Neomarinimicrobiota bacterium]
MTKYKFPFIILSMIMLFILTCTQNDVITGSSENSVLAKPIDLANTQSPSTNDFEEWFTALSDHYHMPPSIFTYIASSQGLTANMCIFAYLIGITPDNIDSIIPNSNTSIRDSESKLYAFRDDFLTKSSRGKGYIAAYYIISKYGIENNLVNQYYKEHFKLLKNSTKIAYTFQHSNDDNQVLINQEINDDLKSMLRIYRKSRNHRDIDAVLDYLEADLTKYTNRPKIEIVADFE